MNRTAGIVLVAALAALGLYLGIPALERHFPSPRPVAGVIDRLFLESGSSVNDLRFSPDGQWLAAAGGKFARSTVIWNLDRRTEKRVMGSTTADSWSVDFSPEKKYLACGNSDSTVSIYMFPSGVELLKSSPLSRRWGVREIRYFADGSKLAAQVGNDVHVFDTSDLSELRRLFVIHDVGYFAVIRHEQSIVCAMMDGPICIWPPDVSGNYRVVGRGGDVINLLASGHEGSLLASVEGRATLRMWDLRNKQQVWKQSVRDLVYVHAISFSNDGRALAVSSGIKGHGVLILEARSGQVTKVWPSFGGGQLDYGVLAPKRNYCGRG